MDLHGKKFAASYSGGKDSMLALYRAINMGLEPHCLITSYNTDIDRTWFHGLPEHLLKQVAASIGIDVRLIITSGEEYGTKFEAMLSGLREEGVEVCVFGDIDIEEHRRWCTDRCDAAGVIPLFPLWQEPRGKLVHEFIDLGFRSMITTIDLSRMPGHFLGSTLSREIAAEIEASGADICGENGEYHTFTYDGPLFKSAVDVNVSDTLEKSGYLVLKLE